MQIDIHSASLVLEQNTLSQNIDIKGSEYR